MIVDECHAPERIPDYIGLARNIDPQDFLDLLRHDAGDLIPAQFNGIFLDYIVHIRPRRLGVNGIHHTSRIILVVQDQPAAHTRLSISNFPKEERVRLGVIIEVYFVGIGPVEICHERFAQLVPDTAIADGGAKIRFVSSEHKPGTVSARIQRDRLERLGTVWLAAILEK